MTTDGTPPEQPREDWWHHMPTPPQAETPPPQPVQPTQRNGFPYQVPPAGQLPRGPQTPPRGINIVPGPAARPAEQPPTAPLQRPSARPSANGELLGEFMEPADPNPKSHKVLGFFGLLIAGAVVAGVGIQGFGYTDEVRGFIKNAAGYRPSSASDPSAQNKNSTVAPSVTQSPTASPTDKAAALTPLQCVQKIPATEQIESKLLLRIDGDNLPAAAESLRGHQIGFVLLSKMPQDQAQIKAFKNEFSKPPVVLLKEKAIVYPGIPTETAEPSATALPSPTSPVALPTAIASNLPITRPTVTAVANTPAAQTPTAVESPTAAPNPTESPTSSLTESPTATAPASPNAEPDLMAAALNAEVHSTELNSAGIDGVIINWADLRINKNIDGTGANGAFPNTDPASVAAYAKLYASAIRRGGLRNVISEGFGDVTAAPAAGQPTPPVDAGIAQDELTTYKLPGFFDISNSINGAVTDNIIAPDGSKPYDALRELTGDTVPLFSDTISKKDSGDAFGANVLEAFRSGADIVALEPGDNSKLSDSDFTAITKQIAQAEKADPIFANLFDQSTLRIMHNKNDDPCESLPNAASGNASAQPSSTSPATITPTTQP